jgi:hypothetical protein
MRKAAMIVAILSLAMGTAPVVAAEAGQKPGASDLSAQKRRPPTRLRVRPGRLLYRDCTFHLARQWRPSGTVIVPVQHCWWVRG